MSWPCYKIKQLIIIAFLVVNLQVNREVFFQFSVEGSLRGSVVNIALY